MYYVYVWSKQGNVPFYVGLGRTANRWNPYTAVSRNRHCRMTVKAIGADNVQVRIIENLTKADACRLEKTLIAYYGRRDMQCGPLTNMTDGGDGIQNVSLESRNKISTAAKSQAATRSERIKGSKNPMFNPDVYAHAVARMNSPEVIEKYSGNNNPAKRPEVRAKLRKMWEDPKFRAARIAKKIGRPIHSDEEKEKRRQKLLDPSNPMREYHKVLNSDPAIKEKRAASLRSPEVQAKISAGLKLAWAKRKGLI